MATPTNKPTPSDSPRYVASSAGAGHDDPVKPISPQSAMKVEANLTEQATAGYHPSLNWYSLQSEDLNWWNFSRDVRAMRAHYAIRKPLNYILGALSNVEWTIEASGPEEADFAAKQLQWFWTNSFQQVFTESATYGWSAAEVVYALQDGIIVQDKMNVVSSWDSLPLINPKGYPVGVQIRSGNGIDGQKGTLRLHAFREDIPNKALWFTHNPIHGGRFGESILYPAWLPWRMLRGRDGAHETAQTAMYRYGTGIIKVWYPPTSNKMAAANAPPNAVNGQVSNRDVAGIIGESIKFGSVVKMPSLFDDNNNRLWDFQVETPNTNLDGILSYVRYLEEICCDAMGVYPELLRASETGSGYSGRAVPLQGFLQAQQPTVNHYTRTWQEQVCMPLVKWNYGADAWVRITPKSLLKTYWKNAQDTPGGGGQEMPQTDPSQQPAMMSTDTDEALKQVLPSMTLDELLALEQELMAVGASDE